MPWECMDGFPACPIVKAEGGFVVDQAVVEPVVQFYKELICEAQNQQEIQLKESFTKAGYDTGARASNLGAFLKMRLNEFLSKQEKASANGSLAFDGNGASVNKANGLAHKVPSPAQSSEWNMRSLLEGVFSIQENSERTETAADSLYDLDLPSFGEYWEFPGKHITIAKGFSSVIYSLSSVLPPGTIQYGKIVEAIHWTDSHNCCGPPVHLHCQDGSIFEADHVIITVSLGVLKAGLAASKGAILNSHLNNLCKTQNVQASTNVESLKDPIQRNGTHMALFQPPLPQSKVEAINRLGFGIVDKVFTLMEPTQGAFHKHMQFIYKNNFDQEKTAIPSWMRKTFSLYPIHSKSRILLAWFAGKEALQMEAFSDDKIASAIESTVSEFDCQKTVHSGYGSIREECKRLAIKNGDDMDNANGIRVSKTSHSNGYHPRCSIKHSKWGTDPLFLGSYSYIAAGSSGVDMDVLAEPVPGDLDNENSEQNIPALQLLFAGEATHRYHYSTTHGAYFSGVREAERLLAYYGWLT
ncbi:hypothetical protein O6H91_10G093400 [Diphasiastrum complanatum]|nr:hypothetical protein O6H91_10G093400 [Diphasiastrum complanatum]